MIGEFKSSVKINVWTLTDRQTSTFKLYAVDWWIAIDRLATMVYTIYNLTVYLPISSLSLWIFANDFISCLLRSCSFFITSAVSLSNNTCSIFIWLDCDDRITFSSVENTISWYFLYVSRSSITYFFSMANSRSDWLRDILGMEFVELSVSHSDDSDASWWLCSILSWLWNKN